MTAELTRAERDRLARVFGDVLPETTRDERSHGEDVEEARERELRRARPPHHG